MSFLKIETERSDAGTSNVNSSDTAFVNTKTIHDANFYKDVIKGLQAELSKVKAENEQLRETVLAYSINLPQVSRKLNTLVACLEAKSYKFNRLKKRRRTEDAEESHFSEESSLNDVDDGECELQDEASEEETSQTIETATSERVRHSVQNFVEVICEEDNSVEDGISTNGDVNDGVVDPGNRKFHSREKKENSVESTLDTSVATARTLTSRTRKLKNLKEKPMSKFKHVREGIIKKNTKQKKVVVRDDIRIQEQVQEFNAMPSEELKASLEELHVDKIDTKIKLEESLEERAMTENVACENIKLSKLRRALQESVISTASNQGANENTSNETTDNSRRGRRRAYDCEVCGRTFARSSNLAHHVMRHRNERPHRCEICDRAFVQKANLKVHLRSHTGERPFSCTECGRAFAQKNNALRHLRAHARQRQLQEQKLVCPICGKTFGRWPSYETHMRRSHSSLESNTNGPVTHCMVQGMVNDSHPANISPSVGGISGGSPHPSVSVSHHVENSMTNSQLPLEPSTLESVLPSTVALVSVHASDSINNGHISQGHHPQNEHVLVGAHVTITAQLNGSHSCTDSNC